MICRKEYKTGEVVMFGGEAWTIESPVKMGNEKINYTLARMRFDELCGYVLEKAYASEKSLEDFPNEMTCEEYSEKLFDFFKPVKKGVPENRGRDELCGSMRCHECPLGSEHLKLRGIENRCSYLMRYEPKIVVELLKAWETKKAARSKRKTYLEDFCEKMPKANFQILDKSAVICRADVYGGKCKDITCTACWNEEMQVENNGQRKTD